LVARTGKTVKTKKDLPLRDSLRLVMFYNIRHVDYEFSKGCGSVLQSIGTTFVSLILQRIGTTKYWGNRASKTVKQEEIRNAVKSFKEFQFLVGDEPFKELDITTPIGPGQFKEAFFMNPFFLEDEDNPQLPLNEHFLQ